MAIVIDLAWVVDNKPVHRQLSLPKGKVLLSMYYLQNLLPHTSKFLSLNAIIQFGDIKSKIEVPSHKDIEGNVYYLVESTLSKEFFIEHSMEALYVSNSSDDNHKTYFLEPSLNSSN